jgi:hypothetical protein
MIDVSYRCRTIRLCSYQCAGQWVPEAMVLTSVPSGVMGDPVRSQFWYRTKEEADAAAVELAKKWIDQKDND